MHSDDDSRRVSWRCNTYNKNTKIFKPEGPNDANKLSQSHTWKVTSTQKHYDHFILTWFSLSQQHDTSADFYFSLFFFFWWNSYIPYTIIWWHNAD